jgi:hypothetical protein
MKSVFLTSLARSAPGEVHGRTRITAVEAETSDDEPDGEVSSIDRTDPSTAQPWMASFGVVAQGEVRGRTRITRTRETSDDDTL